MNRTSSHLPKFVQAIAVGFTASITFGCLTNTPSVSAQIAKPITTIPEQHSNLLGQDPRLRLPPKTQQTRGRARASRLKFVLPLLPNQDAPSGRRRGGASRCPDCSNYDLPVTALVPGEQSQSFLALTISEYPTFWFYVPYRLTAKHTVEFVLQDDKDNYIYKTTFTPAVTPAGVMGIGTAAPLEIGKQYHWTFSVQDRSNFVFVQGLVQRLQPNANLKSQLESATLQERISLYATHGIWHDAITALAELRRNSPQDAALTVDWIDLLQSVGLNNIATEPINQCCTPSRQEETMPLASTF